MKFKKVTARFKAPDPDIAEELICDIFFSFNLKGVVCNIPLNEPDEGFGTHTLPVPEHWSITGFLPLFDSTDSQVEEIKQKTKNLSRLGIHVIVSTCEVDEADWADAWKAYFDVTPVTERITIKPEWKTHSPRADELVIHLDPGMAFGTGTHPTTAMCLQLMDEYFTQGMHFLDVGTGSGILMIAAAKLGATVLSGIDTDPVAIDVAAKNLEKNQIPPDCFNLSCTTLDQMPVQTFDCITANIIAQVIVDILPDICMRMTHTSITFLSGIIQERLPDIIAAINTCKLDIIQKKTQGEWVALAVRKQTSKACA